jgi:CBS domain-containing protein
LFELLCPEEIQAKACLIVMGSEGRGEQTIRTDQDNGLILSGPVDEAKLQTFREAFSGALANFGFPPCPGHVMVNNPLWSRTLDQYIADFSRWTTAPDEQSAMNVAIFYDAESVAGDSSLLLRAKKALVEKAADERVFLGRFARAIESFEPPIGLFNTLKTAEGDGDALDLKKGGIFPIVHGVRSLAIERGLEETNTVKRLHKLGELGVLKPNFARELARALNYLMTLRLDAQLSAQMDSKASGSLLRPATLTSMDRDLLRDSFQVVKQLRDLVRHHFKTNMF